MVKTENNFQDEAEFSLRIETLKKNDFFKVCYLKEKSFVSAYK